MRLRADGHTETDAGRSIELELRRQVLTLWQTALIRLSRLQISDEIAVGLRYYSAALFEVIPQVNAEVREALRSRWPDAGLLGQPILRPGSWIGGDRDGNPNVTADVVRLATGGAAFTALAHYLAELTDLEQDLSMSSRLITVTPEVSALAQACPDAVHRDEPYRRALRLIRGRLTASAAGILDRQPQHELDLDLPPYGGPAELLADLDAIDASLRTHGAALLADDRLALLREGVRVFGFHLSGLDLRQNSDVHEEVIGELLAWAGVHPDYSSLPEDETGRAAGRRTRHPPPAGRRPRRIVRAGPQRARRRRGRRARGQDLRPCCRAQLRHLDVPVGVGHLGGRDPAERGWPAGRLRAGTRTARWASHRCSRRSTICITGRRSCRRCWTCRSTERWWPPGTSRRK